MSADKVLVQCDFDGTVTINDVSFLILDVFGKSDWRQLYDAYREGKISVGRFNTEAFAAVKATRKTLLEFVNGKAELRPGFLEFVAHCREKGLRLVIVSNGLDFYIRQILKSLSLGDIEFIAARTRFGKNGIDTHYYGPDGDIVEDAFKDAYLETFKRDGYRIIYIGNGTSDFSPASKASRIFATEDLLKQCQGTKLNFSPFTDFFDIIKGLKAL